MKTLLLLLALSTGVMADTITIRSDIWCPWNCGPFDEKPGLIIELAKMAFEEKGHTIDYKILGWDESVAACEKGEIVAIPGASKQDAPSFIFPSVSQGETIDGIYIKAGTEWSYSGDDSLKSLGKIAYNDGYEYNKILMDYKEKNPGNIHNSTGDKPLINNIVLMKKGQIGAFVEDPSVFNYTVKTFKINTDHIKFGGTADPTGNTPIFLAFSPKNPKSQEYAKILSDKINSMRASGEFKKLLDSYGLTDWKK